MRLRRRFLWSPFSVVVLESEMGRFEPAAVAGVVGMIRVAGRMENNQEVWPGGVLILIPDPPLPASIGPSRKI